MRPGHEEDFERVTRPLSNKKTPASMRMHMLDELIRNQKGLIESLMSERHSGAASPEDVTDAREFLARLEAIRIEF